MDCRRAKADIALWVRQDCDAKTEVRLEQHLTRCPNCRAYRRQLQRTLETIQDATAEPWPTPSPSVWPRVAARLTVCEESWRRSRFNGWVPALAMTAACVMIFVVASDGSRPRETGWPAPGVETAYESRPRMNARTLQATDLAFPQFRSAPVHPDILRERVQIYFRANGDMRFVPPDRELIEFLPRERPDRADF